MNFTFDITGDPLCLANIRASAAASKEVYARPNITSGDGEAALIQDCGNCIVVAFPGTHDIRDIFTDIKVLKRDVTIAGHACAVHHGFDDSFQSLKQPVFSALAAIEARKPIFMTGHSKAAPVAKRFALEIALAGLGTPIPHVILFGEPRGGDKRYAALYNDNLGPRTLSLSNAADPVPWLPAYLDGYRPGLTNGYLPPGVNEIKIGAPLLYHLAKNFRKILGGWTALAEFRSNPVAAWEELETDSPLLDHHIDSYIARLNALN